VSGEKMNYDTLTRSELTRARAEPEPNGNGSHSSAVEGSERPCAVCGQSFAPATPNQRYCGPTCRNRRPRASRRRSGVRTRTPAPTRKPPGKRSSSGADDLDRQRRAENRKLAEHQPTVEKVLAVLLDAGCMVTVVVGDLELRATR
jgi:hypothetical protein